jgi:hypothetical protein
MKKQDVDPNDPLEFYEKRIRELETLKRRSNSQTMKDLLTKAINQSQLSLQKASLVQQETIAFLKSERTQNGASIKKIDEQIALVKDELLKIDISEATEEEKSILREYLNVVLHQGNTTRQNRDEVIKLQNTVMPMTAFEFQNCLLNLIYKPNPSAFHYDTIVNGLKFLAGLFIPGFDALTAVNENPVSVAMRKKRYVQSGDKILTYIEQYLDVLNKWETLADQYLKLLKE